MKERYKLHNIVFYFMVMIFTAFIVIISLQMGFENDFPTHTAWAADVASGKAPPFLNLFHDLTAFFIKITGAGKIAQRVSAIMSTCILEFCFILAVHYWLNRKLPKNTTDGVKLFSLTVITFAITPFYIPFIFNYLSQRFFHTTPDFFPQITTWHNPTSFAVKPFFIISFFLIIECIASAEKAKKDQKTVRIIKWNVGYSQIIYISLALALLVSCWGKIAGFQVLAPAATVLLAIRFFLSKFSLKKLWGYLLIGITFIPSLIYFFFSLSNYFPGTDQESVSGIEFIGFSILLSNQIFAIILTNLWLLILPIYVTIICWDHVKKSIIFGLSWLTYFFSFVSNYMFRETGSRAADGNNSW